MSKDANSAMRDVDKIRLQIMWSRLLAIVEEQAQVLIRTAFSPTVREAGDLSAGIFDRQGRMLAQAVTGTPGHVNAMASSVRAFLNVFPIDRLCDGDVLVTNDPWLGTGHLNDFTVVTPTFRDGACVALFAATTHIADVGGLGFGPEGRQVFEEGLSIPIMRLFKGGDVNEALIEILKANVRDPIAAEGDLYSLTACNEKGGARLLEMMDEFGLDELDKLASMIVDQSRIAMLAEISAIAPGVYENAMRIDGYDDPIDLVCRTTINEDGVDIDFAGTSDVSSRGINVPLSYAQAYASFGVRCIIGNEIPNNAGSLSTVRVDAPEGCILNPARPAAVSARHAVGQMLPDVVFGCLKKAGLETPAEGASCLFGPVFLGGEGATPGATGQPFVINPFYNGGTGARARKDGLSTTAFPSGVKITPTEINETTAPLIIWRKEYRPGSAGDGEFRGGLGQFLEFSHAQNEPFIVSKMFDRLSHPPRGRDGGNPGMPAKVYIKGGETLSGMGRSVIPPGARFVIETPGGGGMGDPNKRSKTAREKDRKNELL